MKLIKKNYPTLNDITEIIKQFIIENRLTQAEFSNLIGYSESYLNRVLNGQDKISEKFRISVLHFIDNYSKPNDDISQQELRNIVLNSQEEINRLKKRLFELESLLSSKNLKD